MYKQYYDGRLIDGEGIIVNVLDPSDGTIIDIVKSATAAQTNEALETAHASFKGWAKLPVDERAAWICKFADAVEKKREYISDLLSAESGKPFRTACEDLDLFVDYMRFCAQEGKRIEGVSLPTTGKPYGDIYHFVERRPLGVVVAHIAWNYPIAMAALKIGPAMIAGCPIIVKPSSETPLSTLFLGVIAHDIGLPKGVVSFLSGPSAIVAKTLNTSKIPRMITLIGSSATGRQVMQEGSTSVKRYSLELGGNAPVIIMPDADLPIAVAHTIGMKTSNCGQICTSYNRIYVHEKIYDKYCGMVAEGLKQLKMGCKHDDGNIVGPMINRESRDRMINLIDEAVKNGAILVCGGEIPSGMEAGNFITPALLKNVGDDMRVCREEIFGPIISVQPFSNIDDALDKAVDTEYGLASYLFGHDARDIAKAFERFESGDIFINGASGGNNTPHIGIKQSGLGCDQSIWSIEEYFDLKRISMIP